MGTHSHSIVNEVPKRLIFRCFLNYSVSDALIMTLTGSIYRCRLVADGTEEATSLAPDAISGQAIKPAFRHIRNHSLPMHLRIRQSLAPRLHLVISAMSGPLQRKGRGDGMRLSINRFYYVPYRRRFSRFEQDSQSSRIGI